jgi:hypothetical protein
MTDKYEIDQEVELHDEVENEVVEEAHDPKNAEAQSVDSVDKAGDAVKGKASTPTQGTAKNNTTQDPMPKTKAGLIAATVGKMQSMNREQLQAMYNYKQESVDQIEGEQIAESDFVYQADFSQDLNALVESEATLSEEFKAKAEVIFEAAIKSKLSEEIDRLEAKYEEELAEEVATTKADLVEKVDSYLNYVVEQWMEDNKVAVERGLRTEIAEKFMASLKDLFVESYIEVPESKVDLVDELAQEVEELEEQLNAQTGKAIAMAEELEVLKRESIIREASRDLAETQVEKLKSLVADVDFDDEEIFTSKVATVKESYFNKKATTVAEEVEEDGDFEVEVSESMSQYLSAIKKTSK